MDRNKRTRRACTPDVILDDASSTASTSAYYQEPPAAKRRRSRSIEQQANQAHEEHSSIDNLHVLCSVEIMSNVMRFLESKDVGMLALRVNKRMSQLLKLAVHSLDLKFFNVLPNVSPPRLRHLDHLASLKRLSVSFKECFQWWEYKLPSSIEQLDIAVRSKRHGEQPMQISNLIPILFTMQIDTTFGARIHSLRLAGFEMWHKYHLRCLYASRLPSLQQLALENVYGNEDGLNMSDWTDMFASHTNLTHLTFSQVEYRASIRLNGDVDFGACRSVTHLNLTLLKTQLIALPPNLKSLIIEFPYDMLHPNMPSLPFLTDLEYKVHSQITVHPPTTSPLFSSSPFALERLFPNVEKMSFSAHEPPMDRFDPPTPMSDIRRRFPRLRSLDSVTLLQFGCIWKHIYSSSHNHLTETRENGDESIMQEDGPIHMHATPGHSLLDFTCRTNESLRHPIDFMPSFPNITISYSRHLLAISPTRSFASISRLTIETMECVTIPLLLSKLHECASALHTLQHLELRGFHWSFFLSSLSPPDFGDFKNLLTFKLECRDMERRRDMSRAVETMASMLYNLPTSLTKLKVGFWHAEDIIRMQCEGRDDVAGASVDVSKLCRRLSHLKDLSLSFNCTGFDEDLRGDNSFPFTPHLERMSISTWRSTRDVFNKRRLKNMMSQIGRTHQTPALTCFSLNLLQPTLRMVIDGDEEGAEYILTPVAPNPSDGSVVDNAWTLSSRKLRNGFVNESLHAVAAWHVYDYC